MGAILRTGIVVLLCLLISLTACDDGGGEHSDDGKGGCYKVADDQSDSGAACN